MAAGNNKPAKIDKLFSFRLKILFIYYNLWQLYLINYKTRQKLMLLIKYIDEHQFPITK